MRTPRTRRGFTLIELLVVIGIILIIAALGYYLLPSLIGNQNRARAVDQLTEWLLTSKVRARRDIQATGLRLLFNGQPVPTTGTAQFANQVAFVQQPDPVTGTTCDGTFTDLAGTMPSPMTATAFVRFSNVDFLGPAGNTTPVDLSQASVQPGDYLELNLTANVHQITGITLNANATTTLTLASNIPPFSGPIVYRVLRQPRLLLGEEIKPLGAELVIDLNAGKCLNVPQRTIAATTFTEIVFSPSGSVIGQGTSAGKVVLWISDQAITNTPAPPSLVVVNTRSGYIGAYDVAPGADPYLFTEDGRSGGF